MEPHTDATGPIAGERWCVGLYAHLSNPTPNPFLFIHSELDPPAKKSAHVSLSFFLVACPSLRPFRGGWWLDAGEYMDLSIAMYRVCVGARPPSISQSLDLSRLFAIPLSHCPPRPPAPPPTALGQGSTRRSLPRSQSPRLILGSSSRVTGARSTGSTRRLSSWMGA